METVEVTNLVGTVYWPTTRHDETPNQLANGSHIDKSRSWAEFPVSIPVVAPHRIIALSRDLLSRWGGLFQYGDVVHVTGTGNLDGEWTVRDTMNARFTRRCDFLVPPYFLAKYEGVTVKLAHRPQG